MTGGKASPPKLKIQERREFSLQLRLAGYSYRDIAAQLEAEHGIKTSAASVMRDVEYEVQRAAKRREELATELFELSIARTEAMVRAHWPQAVGGQTTAIDNETGEEVTVLIHPDVASARLVLEVTEKYAKWFGWGGKAGNEEERLPTEALIYMRQVPDVELDSMIANLLPALRGASPHGGGTAQ
jgi:hypothetical protein